MKVETFVKLFNTKRTDKDKEKAVSEIMKNDHISFSDKVGRANLIARKSYYKKTKQSDGIEQQIFEQNSAAKYMLYSLTLVDLYTTLEIEYKKSLEQFELINGEIIDMIMKFIDERELKEFKMILEFACDDLIANEYELHAFIRKQV